MNIDELSDFLEMVVAADRRHIGDGDFAVWGSVLADVTFKDASSALIEHLGKSTDYLMPVHIKTIAKRLVKERFENTPEPIPPAEIADDPQAYLSWRRRVQQQIKDGTYVAPEPPALVKRDLRALAESFKPPVEEPAELVDTVDETHGEETGQGKAA